MVLIGGLSREEFYITMNCGAQAEARRDGVGLTFRAPARFDARHQIPVLDAAVASRPDAILIAPTDSVAMYAPIKRAADAGIKVVLVDTTLDDPAPAISQIASDNGRGGRAAARTLTDLMGGPGTAYVINSDPNITSTNARVQGFEDEARRLGIDVIGEGFDRDDPNNASTVVRRTLRRHPEVKGIFGTNLLSAEGAADGLRAAGRRDVKMVSFDAGPLQVQQLRQNVVQALIAQRPAEIGARGVREALAALAGHRVDARVTTGFVPITRKTLAQNKSALYEARC
jgi:ribose transport system substrate-binding protein